MSIQQQYYGRSRHSHHSQHSANSHQNAAAKDWPCIECTFVNTSSKTRCDMCLTAKPLNIQTSTDVSISNGNININDNNKSNKKPAGLQFTTSLYDSPAHQSPASNNNINNNNKNGYYNSNINNNNQNNNQNNNDSEEIGRRPNHSIIPANVAFNPKKTADKQSIFDRWMIAQLERASGQQPQICVANNIMLTNLRRVRAPTTCRTLQQQINQNTNAIYHANNLDAGDFTDDEEDELSSIYPGNSPRSQNSQNGNFGFSPTPSDNDDEYGQTFSTHLNAKKQQAASHSHLFGARQRRNNHNNNSNEMESKDDNYNSSKHIQRTFSTDDATQFTYNHKKLLDKRRRKKSRNKNKKQSVALLWYKAQSQLKEGRNPQILNKYNITLTNIRQHNPRFRDYQRRKSHHEKAVTYLQVTGDKLHTNNRDHIANDDDENYDEAFSDTENDHDSQTITPIANNNQYNFNQSNQYAE